MRTKEIDRDRSHIWGKTLFLFIYKVTIKNKTNRLLKATVLNVFEIFHITTTNVIGIDYRTKTRPYV